MKGTLTPPVIITTNMRKEFFHTLTGNTFYTHTHIQQLLVAKIFTTSNNREHAGKKTQFSTNFQAISDPFNPPPENDMFQVCVRVCVRALVHVFAACVMFGSVAVKEQAAALIVPAH